MEHTSELWWKGHVAVGGVVVFTLPPRCPAGVYLGAPGNILFTWNSESSSDGGPGAEMHR